VILSRAHVPFYLDEVFLNLLAGGSQTALRIVRMELHATLRYNQCMRIGLLDEWRP
jgi:hypothetical protein